MLKFCNEDEVFKDIDLVLSKSELLSDKISLKSKFLFLLISLDVRKKLEDSILSQRLEIQIQI